MLGGVQKGDRQNVITNLKISDTELTGTGRQAHAVNHCIQRTVGSVKVDAECTTTCLYTVCCVYVRVESLKDCVTLLKSSTVAPGCNNIGLCNT